MENLREVGYMSTQLLRRVQNQHMVSSVQLTAFAVLLLVVIKQHCITAGAPFWIGGELPVFVVRPHAPNRDGPPLIYIYIYIIIFLCVCYMKCIYYILYIKRKTVKKNCVFLNKHK